MIKISFLFCLLFGLMYCNCVRAQNDNVSPRMLCDEIRQMAEAGSFKDLFYNPEYFKGLEYVKGLAGWKYDSLFVCKIPYKNEYSVPVDSVYLVFCKVDSFYLSIATLISNKEGSVLVKENSIVVDAYSSNMLPKWRLNNFKIDLPFFLHNEKGDLVDVLFVESLQFQLYTLIGGQVYYCVKNLEYIDVWGMSLAEIRSSFFSTGNVKFTCNKLYIETQNCLNKVLGIFHPNLCN